MPGAVNEVASKEGPLQLKVDPNHVAIVPAGSVRVRNCTAAELSQAQAKFASLKPEAQRDEKKKIADARTAAACATCRKVKATAQKNYTEQTKAMREQREALRKEALAWASAS